MNKQYCSITISKAGCATYDQERNEMGNNPEVTKSTEANKPTSGLAAVAFFNLPDMYEQDAMIAFSAIQELHNRLREVGFPKGVLVMSAFTGAIVVVRDGAFNKAKKDEPHAIHHYLGGLCSNFAKSGLPIRIGVTYGKVSYFKDIVGGTYIGPPVNKAARIACAKENTGLLYHESYLKQVGDDPYQDKYRPDPQKPEQAKGKEHDGEKGFTCFLPIERPPMVDDYVPPNIPEHKIEATITAFIVAVDLPRFSTGSMNVLGKRFRGFSEAGHSVLTEHDADELFYSPGGDGGVFAFVGVEPGHKAQGILKLLAHKLNIETELNASNAAVQTRVGAHYGRVSIYKNTQGNLIPTGRHCYIADQIASDIADASIACTQSLREDGHPDFEPLPGLEVLKPINLGVTGIIARYLLSGGLKQKVSERIVSGKGNELIGKSENVLIETLNEEDEKKLGDADDYNDRLTIAANTFCDIFLLLRSEIQKQVAEAVGLMSMPKKEKLNDAIKKHFCQSLPRLAKDSKWFDDSIVKLERIEKQSGISMDEIDHLRTIHNIVFLLGFPRERLTYLATQLQSGGALIIEDSVATHVLAELSAAFAAQVAPKFNWSDDLGVRGEGLLHYVKPPLDNPDVERRVANLLKDLAAQLSVNLEPEETGKDAGDTIEYWAGQLNRAMTMYSKRRIVGTNKSKSASLCRFYCVIDSPRTEITREKLKKLLKVVNDNVDNLALFVLDAKAPTKQTEEILMQILKDRFTEKPN